MATATNMKNSLVKIWNIKYDTDGVSEAFLKDQGQELQKNLQLQVELPEDCGQWTSLVSEAIYEEVTFYPDSFEFEVLCLQ